MGFRYLWTQKVYACPIIGQSKLIYKCAMRYVAQQELFLDFLKWVLKWLITCHVHDIKKTKPRIHQFKFLH